MRGFPKSIPIKMFSEYFLPFSGKSSAEFCPPFIRFIMSTPRQLPCGIFPNSRELFLSIKRPVSLSFRSAFLSVFTSRLTDFRSSRNSQLCFCRCLSFLLLFFSCVLSISGISEISNPLPLTTPRLFLIMPM